MKTPIAKLIQVPATDKVAVLYPTGGYHITNNVAVAMQLATTIPEGGLNPPPSLSKRPVVLSILTTLQCNLRCPFCYVHDVLDQQDLTFDIAKQRIDELLLETGSLGTISFIGGEPTLNMALIYEVVQYVKEAAPTCGFAIVTNGTTLLDTFEYGLILDWLVQERFTLQVSLDGPLTIHNATRPSLEGFDAFARIMRGLQYYVSEYPEQLHRLKFRGTFEAGTGDLLERIVFAHELLANGVGTKFQLEVSGYSSNNADIDHQTIINYQNQLMGVARWYIDHPQRDTVPITLTLVASILKRLINKQALAFHCRAGDQNAYRVLDVDGAWLACHRKVGCGLRTDEDVTYWTNSVYHLRPDCKACGIRPFCGGGCRAIAAAEGDREHSTDFYCQLKLVQVKVALYLLTTLGATEISTRLAALNEKD
jgi:uncharacterized protein